MTDPRMHAIKETHERVNEFFKKQPYYLDKLETMFRWNHKKKIWEPATKLDLDNDVKAQLSCYDLFMKEVRDQIHLDVKTRGKELYNSHLETRETLDVDLSKFKLQFGRQVFDVRHEIDAVGQAKDAEPFDFMENIIPHSMGDNMEMPFLEKLFSDWTGGKPNLLKDIIAYCAIKGNPLKLIFFYHGKGDSGKSQFLKLLAKFFSINDVISSNYSILSDGSERFELYKLREKKICLISEIDSKKVYSTNTLKLLSGNDLIRAEKKGSQELCDFYFEGKIHIATNDIPTLKDSGDTAFLGRCVIVDFPNSFEPLAKDIIQAIPKKEFQSLSRYVFLKLREWEKNSKIEISDLSKKDERIRIYAAKSNPVLTFFEKCIEWDLNYDPLNTSGNDSDYKIRVSELLESLNGYLKSHQRQTLSSQDLGYFLKNKYNGQFYKERVKGSIDSGVDYYQYIGFRINFDALKSLTSLSSPTSNVKAIRERYDLQTLGTQGSQGRIDEIKDFIKSCPDEEAHLDDLYNEFGKRGRDTVTKLLQSGLLFQHKKDMVKVLET